MRLLAAAVAAAAALVLLTSKLPWLAAAVGMPAALLGYAALKASVSLQLTAGLILLAELVLLGGSWPSLYTLMALLILPALGISISCLVRRRAPARSAIYLDVSGLAASCSLLLMAYDLTTL